MAGRRPFGVTLVAIIAWLTGALQIIAGVLLLIGGEITFGVAVEVGLQQASLLLIAAARSRLTRAPDTAPRKLDRCSVSAITSAENEPSARTSTTVRHTPLTAIESPCPASDVTTGPRMTSRAESPRSSLLTTSPSSSTIPVNTLPA